MTAEVESQFQETSTEDVSLPPGWSPDASLPTLEGTEDDEYGGEFIYKEILPAYYSVSKNNPQYKFVLLSINNNEI